MDTWSMIDDERTEFAALCDGLDPAQWDAPSLCHAWRVRDVVSHVTQGATLTTGRAMFLVVRHGFRINTMLRETAIKGGGAPVEQLARDLRASIGTRRTPPGVKPAGVLTDDVIHQQDIRRALNIPRVIDQARLRVALDETKDATASFLPAKTRIAGLHLHATDMDWSTGTDGTPDVGGSGEALLMAMAGRQAALADLSGSGVTTLASRP